MRSDGIPAGEKAPEGFFDIAGKYGIITNQGHMDPETGLPEMKSYRYVAAVLVMTLQQLSEFDALSE